MKSYLSKPYPRLILACLLAGVACGLLTYLLDKAIRLLYAMVFAGMNPDTANPHLIFVPAAGMLLSLAYTRFVVKDPISLGSYRVRNYLKEKQYDIPARLMWAPAIGTSVTLGLGGSAGAEGPSALAGAAIGSNIARKMKLSNDQLRLMVGIGAGAGIAGIFRSPIGGVLFTLEVLRMPISTLPVIGLIASALTAGLTSFLLAGRQYEVLMLTTDFPPLSEVPWILGVGILCGLYSLYYNFIMNNCRNMLQSIDNLQAPSSPQRLNLVQIITRGWKNPWIIAIVTGLMVGLAIFLFPDLYSTGYQSLGRLLDSDTVTLTQYSPMAGAIETPQLLIVIALGIALIKAFACSATNFGGGVAGNFAPTLFAGGFVGFFFAMACNLWLGTELHVANYVYIGMAGVMSGVIEAPLMAMFLTAEMSGHSVFLWPLAIVSVVSWIVVQFFPHRTHM